MQHITQGDTVYAATEDAHMAIAGWAVYGRDYFAQPGDAGYNAVMAWVVMYDSGKLETFDPQEIAAW